MLTDPLPATLDARKAATRGVTVEGVLKPRDLPRFQALLASENGTIQAQLRFSRDEEMRCLVSLRVEADVDVTCQRCLEPLAHAVRSRFVLGLVTSIAEAKRLPDTYESLLAEEETVSPRDLVEEELLLALPAVPRHTERCFPTPESRGLRAEQEDKSAESPFAVLARLGQRGDED